MKPKLPARRLIAEGMVDCQPDPVDIEIHKKQMDSEREAWESEREYERDYDEKVREEIFCKAHSDGDDCFSEEEEDQYYHRISLGDWRYS